MKKISLIISILFTQSLIAGYIIKKRTHLKTKKSKIISVTPVNLGLKKKTLKKIRESISEKSETAPILYQEIYYPGDIPSNLSTLRNMSSSFPGHEVLQIVKQGDDKNRIILTILGDGYTNQEKKRFFLDAKRIVKDLFGELTFKSYLPLFNIYAIFTPSRESGITDRKRKDTAFGLYRAPKGSKRGVMPGKRSRIEKALKLINAYTDYPVIIANDDYYGGLGGRYAITTRSLTSGSMVLRHELGHNFSNVGEEYDGGGVYSGANFSSSKNVSWKHWLSKPLVGPYRHYALHGNYVWKNLKSKQSTSLSFKSEQELNYEALISIVGWEKAQDVQITLNGKKLSLSGMLSKDRSFFKSKLMKLAKGDHKLTVQNLSSKMLTLAYARGNGYPSSYNFKKNLVSAFSVYRSGRRFTGYRPTHKMCLMRDMRSKHFCPVDQENIWLRFLDRLNLIDSFKKSGSIVSFSALAVGKTSFQWYKKTSGSWSEMTALRNKVKAKLDAGSYRVKAHFSHPEIRKSDPRTNDSLSFSIN